MSAVYATEYRANSDKMFMLASVYQAARLRIPAAALRIMGIYDVVFADTANHQCIR